MHGKFLFIMLLFLCSPLHAQQPPAGDITGDGKVDSTDLARGVQIALGQPPPAAQSEIDDGDLNRDGRITVQDLVLIRSTIAGGNRPPVADASASPDTGLTGTDIQLDATRSFDLDDDALTYRWQQLHMNRFSTEYITENKVMLSDSTSATPTFNPEWPGNYRFEMQVMEVTGLVDRDTLDVLVREEGVRQLDVKGIVFADLFGELGGPQFDAFPDDPDSLAAVQGRAMEGPERIGAGWVGIVPAAWYARINPLPEIAAADNFLSLTNESDYAALAAAAHSKGLKVIHREQLAAGILPLRPGELDSLQTLMETSAAWWDHWFTVWKNYLLSRVNWAEKYGVEMFDLYHFAEETFRPTVYPQYGERWREIIAAVRERYSGLITMNLINTEGFNFADALDVLHLTVFPGLYTTRGVMADIRNPTLAEIRSISEEIFDGHEFDVREQVPVYYIFIAINSDGQVAGDPVPPPLSELDNGEQVIYYEGFFQALKDETWVHGLFSERWDWFDEPDKPGVFFDAVIGDSPRNKPVEKAIKLWFGIY